MGRVPIILRDGAVPVKMNHVFKLKENVGLVIRRLNLLESAVPWRVESDRQLFLIMEKVLIRGKDRDLIPCRDGTDQEIDLGAQDPGLPAGIIEFSGPLIIRLSERQVSKLR